MGCSGPPPSIPRQDKIGVAAPHPRLPRRGIKTKTGLLAQAPVHRDPRRCPGMAPFLKPPERRFLKGGGGGKQHPPTPPPEGGQRLWRGSGGSSTAAPLPRSGDGGSSDRAAAPGGPAGPLRRHRGGSAVARPGRAGCGRAALRPSPLLRQQRCPRVPSRPPPPPPPGTSPACKTLSGFSNVKDGDNFKPLKPDGVSSPSFSDCKAPRLATRCADSPHPPKKEGDRPLGEGAGSGREGKRQDPRPAAGPERGERPPAGSPRPRLASYLQNGEALSDTTLTFCQVYFTCYTQTIQTGKNRNISQWSMYWYKLFSSTDVTEQI